MLLFNIMVNIVFSIILGPSIKIFANRWLPPTEKRCQSTSNQALPLSTGSGNTYYIRIATSSCIRSTFDK